MWGRFRTRRLFPALAVFTLALAIGLVRAPAVVAGCGPGSCGTGLNNAPAPSYVTSLFRADCQAGANVVEGNWLSPPGHPAQTTYDVNPGDVANTLKVQLNLMTYRCPGPVSNAFSNGYKIYSPLTYHFVGNGGEQFRDVYRFEYPFQFQLFYPDPDKWHWFNVTWDLVPRYAKQQALSLQLPKPITEDGVMHLNTSSRGTIGYHYPGPDIWRCAVNSAKGQQVYPPPPSPPNSLAGPFDFTPSHRLPGWRGPWPQCNMGDQDMTINIHLNKPNWNLTGKSEVTDKSGNSASAINPGDTVYFHHKVHNDGPDPASYSWWVEGQYCHSAGPCSSWETGWYSVNGKVCNLGANTGANKCPLPSGSPNNVDKNDNAPDYPPPPSPSTVVWTAPGPAKAQTGDTYCERIWYSDSNGPGTKKDHSQEACIAIGQPACGNVDSSPTFIQPGDSYWFTVSASVPGASSVDFEHIKSSGLGVDVPLSHGHSTGASYSWVSGRISPVPAPSAGSYNISYDVYANGQRVLSCKDGLTIADMPYFKVYGSGVMAGGVFPGETLSPGSGLLASWGDNTAAYRGASSELSNLALIKITGVASAQTTPGRSPTSLTFANNNPADISTDAFSPNLGGNFGDPFPMPLPGPPKNETPNPVSPVNIGTAHGNVYYHPSGSGELTVNGGALSPGDHISIFTDGDVYIDGSGISYSGAIGGWASPADIPSLVVVATGNIYIDPGVRELDGIYIAHPDSQGNGGQIFTCAYASGPVSAGAMYGTCSKQLQVVGAFVANNVKLMRTLGTLKDAIAGESPQGRDGAKNTKSCTNGGVSPLDTCAAEVFQFSPEMELSSWNVQTGTCGTVCWDSVTSLPPVL